MRAWCVQERVCRNVCASVPGMDRARKNDTENKVNVLLRVLLRVDRRTIRCFERGSEGEGGFQIGHGAVSTMWKAVGTYQWESQACEKVWDWYAKGEVFVSTQNLQINQLRISAGASTRLRHI